VTETRNAYENLVSKLQGRIPSGTPVVTWEDDIKVYTKIG
jgi:hypothetical protein